MTVEGAIIKVNENEEPPTVLVQFNDGEVFEYSITDLVGMYVSDEELKATQPAPYNREGDTDDKG